MPDLETTFSTLGARASGDILLGGLKATLYGEAGWRHAFDDRTPTAAFSLAGSDAFVVKGTPINEDIGFVEAGVDFDITPSATLGVSYEGQFGDDTTDHGARLDFSYRF